MKVVVDGFLQWYHAGLERGGSHCVGTKMTRQSLSIVRDWLKEGKGARRNSCTESHMNDWKGGLLLSGRGEDLVPKVYPQLRLC